MSALGLSYAAAIVALVVVFIVVAMGSGRNDHRLNDSLTAIGALLALGESGVTTARILAGDDFGVLVSALGDSNVAAIVALGVVIVIVAVRQLVYRLLRDDHRTADRAMTTRGKSRLGAGGLLRLICHLGMRKAGNRTSFFLVALAGSLLYALRGAGSLLGNVPIAKAMPVSSATDHRNYYDAYQNQRNYAADNKGPYE